MKSMQKKKALVGRKKFELTPLEEAQFEKEFEAIYDERYEEFLSQHGDKADGIYSRWFDEDMWRLREVKREEFIKRAKSRQKNNDREYVKQA